MKDRERRVEAIAVANYYRYVLIGTYVAAMLILVLFAFWLAFSPVERT